jgi:hypothetical protein
MVMVEPIRSVLELPSGGSRSAQERVVKHVIDGWEIRHALQESITWHPLINNHHVGLIPES